MTGDVTHVNEVQLEPCKQIKVQTNVYLEGISTFKYNHAENGAAIFSIKSKFYIKGNVYVANNNANKMEEASTSWTVN